MWGEWMLSQIFGDERITKPPYKLPDGRLMCPRCYGWLNRVKTPPRCPECLQPLEPHGHVTAKDLDAAGVR